jgi:hypothetical protein
MPLSLLLPTALTAAGTTDSSTNLSWNASTDNIGVTAYNIYNGSTLLEIVLELAIR